MAVESTQARSQLDTIINKGINEKGINENGISESGRDEDEVFDTLPPG
jgi:hypothetical protein